MHLPQKAGTDALHIALAVFYEVDYLVTWNCAHIANGHILRALMKLNESLGRYTPILLTPTKNLDAGGRLARRHPMNCDPIVEETRKVRERLLAQFDGDLGKYVDHLIEEQVQDCDRLVTKEEVLRRKREAAEKQV